MKAKPWPISVAIPVVPGRDQRPGSSEVSEVDMRNAQAEQGGGADAHELVGVQVAEAGVGPCGLQDVRRRGVVRHPHPASSSRCRASLFWAPAKLYRPEPSPTSQPASCRSARGAWRRSRRRIGGVRRRCAGPRPTGRRRRERLGRLRQCRDRRDAARRTGCAPTPGSAGPTRRTAALSGSNPSNHAVTTRLLWRAPESGIDSDSGVGSDLSW